MCTCSTEHFADSWCLDVQLQLLWVGSCVSWKMASPLPWGRDEGSLTRSVSSFPENTLSCQKIRSQQRRKWCVGIKIVLGLIKRADVLGIAEMHQFSALMEWSRDCKRVVNFWSVGWVSMVLHKTQGGSRSRKESLKHKFYKGLHKILEYP